ncbi:MAG: malonate decarboxylase acyl carrier protein [Pantoea sp.]|uniref:Malonate decarboxylase acyl carrier protein n=1 Tax=Pantoea septica TaxID=472695 RepID=A0ABX3URH7_9GAMM|nr:MULTISPECIES: malonate decarboxylase acyl carrier protein [Pantoea]MDU5780800.1 malonate decarboxylase acyl carrier protein [Pantoea sp.]MDU5835912.1 malonate decarboxylase acyl carrier protein [Pantoea sp.]MDU6438502.1 malonate decarboxylase acyl carrier protein [Pantoea sp.]ORM98838.1 malonate decarboxylase acyl carrier protein [Pantoea septica]
MEHITLSFPANRTFSGRALAGVVGSGDMEVLFTATEGQTLSIDITTSLDNSDTRWKALFDRLSLINGLPAGQMVIHDFGATPGVARIRIEQVFEEVSHA